MSAWAERAQRRWMSLVLACLATAAGPSSIRAQGVFERLNLDRLALQGLGVEVGPVRAARVRPTQAIAVHADYGEISRNWRVVFNVTYWGSRFNDETVRRFEHRLRDHLPQLGPQDTVSIGQVTVSDIALEADLRRTFMPRAFARPYVGLGLGVHVINAENPVIDGTFVESALDNIGTGVTALTGMQMGTGRLRAGVQGRYTMLSTVRFGTARGTVSYYFGPGGMTQAPQ